jgi:NodT family efflux transporter outer membrane factor (OMF) lipoprotein
MHLSGNSKSAGAGLTAMALLLAQGCTVGPHYQPPALPNIAAYAPLPAANATASAPGPGGNAQRFDISDGIPAQWWTEFHSTALDSMVQQALSNSPLLAEATAKLRQAQEELNARTGATRYPTVGGNTSVVQQQINLAAYGIPIANPSPFTLLNGSVAVSYALDIFGGNRRLIEGLRAQTAYQQWQLEGARLMLAGNVVSAAIRQAQLNSQIEITRRMLDVEQQELKIVEARRRAGGASDYEVSSQLTAVAQARALLPPLDQQLDAVNDQLAVLMGKSPAEVEAVRVPLDSLNLPEKLPISVPSSLVRQRPDIRAAEALLHQASANVGVATANLYPQIVLTGGGGGVGKSFLSGGDIWNVGASLAQPIYNGGALRAEQRKAQASYDEAGAVYRQTVLEAFEQVADVLYAIQNDAQALQARTEAATAADSAFEIASARYRAGGVSQISLLDAERQQLQTKLDRTASDAGRYSDSATLFEALGGGWWSAKTDASTH